MTHADDIDAMQIGPDPDKLLVYHRQQLSAMLDGELSPDQAKFMLRRLQHDGELAACWDRWQVCGDMLRGHHHALLPSDFAARVANGIAGDAQAEVEVAAVAARPASRRLRWGGGAALAASVALVAVFAPRMMPAGGAPQPSPVQQPVLASSSPAAAANGTPMVADAAPGEESPSRPSPADAAPAVLATAVAAAEVPRRAAERRVRAQEQRVAAASRAQALAGADDVPVGVVAVAGMPPLIDTTARQGAFPAPATLEPRPWPRAILPGAGQSAFSVGYGQVPASVQDDDAAYDPFFRPRIPVPVIPSPPAGAEAGPGEREASPAGGGIATQ